MNIDDAIKSIRNNLKVLGINCRVRKSMACQTWSVQFISKKYEEPFTILEHHLICSMCKKMGLTFAMGMEIDPYIYIRVGISHDKTTADQINFEFNENVKDI